MIGESSRKDWYNRRLYISHLKTNKSRMGTPYDFQLKDIPESKNAIDHMLRPDHPHANRKVPGRGRCQGERATWLCWR
jgi:hypothetical protein